MTKVLIDMEEYRKEFNYIVENPNRYGSKASAFRHGVSWANAHIENPWRKVADSLPEKGVVVLVSNGEQRCVKLNYLNDNGEWTYRCVFAIKYWCFVPTLPKTE